jgi:hypothetical protein
MKEPPPLTAVFMIFVSAFLIFGLFACTTEPTAFKLTVKHDPVGKSLEYKLESHRVGAAYKNGELVEDFDVKIEGDIIYTTQKVLADGNCVVLEENIWSWDEPAKDSCQVKRITRDYAYKYQVATSGKVTNLKMMGKPSQQWEDYVISFFEQGMPIFPEEKISVGYQWTQTTPVILPDSQTTEVSMVYTIKGTAQKQGYHCAIIEYNGDLAIPLHLEPADTLSSTGVDWIEVSGILYFAIKEGMGVNTEERRRVVRERYYTKKGEAIERRDEFEATTSSNLVSFAGG